jgi:hypothetical protein
MGGVTPATDAITVTAHKTLQKSNARLMVNTLMVKKRQHVAIHIRRNSLIKRLAQNIEHCQGGCKNNRSPSGSVHFAEALPQPKKLGVFGF